VPRICPATDRETTGTRPSRWERKALVNLLLVADAAGRRATWIKLIIRRSLVQVQPAPQPFVVFRVILDVPVT
jgi:hypothetical protein